MTPEQEAAMAAHNERSARHRKSFDTAVEWTKSPNVRSVYPHMIDIVNDLVEIIQWYDDGIAWGTSCTHCGQLMNENYAQYEQITEYRVALQAILNEAHKVMDRHPKATVVQTGTVKRVE